jgi:hypothetical protein
MFITKKHLPRRTFLRGMGVSLALPFFDSMLPAQTPLSKSGASPGLRAGFLYMQHGAIMDYWTPETEGANFEFKKILKTIEPFRDQTVIVSGMEVKTAGPAPGESGGDHVRSAAAFLSGARPKHTAGADYYLGTTTDQVIAKKIGQDTVLPSIELGIEDVGYTGICNYGYSCAYVNTISWESPANRCRWKSIRRWSSSGCLATVARRHSDSLVKNRTEAYSIRSRMTLRALRKDHRSKRSKQA